MKSTPEQAIGTLLVLLILSSCAAPAPLSSTQPLTAAPVPDRAITAACTPEPTLVPSPTTVVTPSATHRPTVVSTFSPTATPSSTPGSTAIPTATPSTPSVVILKTANIRGGPGTNYSVVASGKIGDEYEICGRNQAADWVQLCGYSEPQRWVYVGADLRLAEVAGLQANQQLNLVDPIPTPPLIFTLSGTVFFDYNGDGVCNSGEPPIAGASIQAGGTSAKTGNDGTYALVGLAAGQYQVRVSAPGFRYLSLSTAGFQSSDQPVSLAISAATRRDWGLMQGFLTLPVKANVTYSIKNYVDAGDVYDHTYMQDWKGGTETYAGHQGVDFDISDHTVVAAAPGIVIAAQDDYETNPDLKGIGARVIVWYGNGYFTQYNDLKTLAVNRLAFDQKLFRENPHSYVANLQAPQAVQRGQVLGNTGYLGPPLDGIVHFENWTIDPAHTKGEPARIIDPFKLTSERGGVFANRLFSLWTSENTPIPSP